MVERFETGKDSSLLCMPAVHLAAGAKLTMEFAHSPVSMATSLLAGSTTILTTR
jgi:hypothetical protein